MKKLLAMSLIGCMALSMVACGSGETETATTEPAAMRTIGIIIGAWRT